MNCLTRTQCLALTLTVTLVVSTVHAQIQVQSYQASKTMYGKDTVTSYDVGVRLTDTDSSMTIPVTVSSPSVPQWTTAGPQGTNPVSVDWQGTFTNHGVTNYDAFTVASTNSLIRQGSDRIIANWYQHESLVTAVETAANLGFSFGPNSNNDDEVFIEGIPDIPVRSIRLELFESAAGGESIGSVIHSVEYASPFDVEPFMSVRNYHYEPVHYTVSTGTFDFPMEIGDHDEYAAILGMVGDGVVRTLPAAGDFDGNGVYGGDDMDALTLQIFETSMGVAADLNFDITGDGMVDPADGEQWLANAGAVNNANGNPFLPADGNLDGTVDGSDFILWNAHKFSTNPNWTRGNWNYDGVVDGSDFLLWNAHKFNTSDGMNMVPEPPTAGMVYLVLLVLLKCRRDDAAS